MTKQTNTHKLVTSAILMALAFVLSFVKIIDYPWGGSVTLFSMLPICIISLKYGLAWGLGSGFCYALLQLLQGLGEAMGWGLTPAAWIGVIAFDYLLAFTAIGAAGILRRSGKDGIFAGVTLALTLRYVSSVLSGAIVWKSIGEVAFGWTFENTWLYSLVYNAFYMVPELILTLAGLAGLMALNRFAQYLSH